MAFNETTITIQTELDHLAEKRHTLEDNPGDADIPATTTPAQAINEIDTHGEALAWLAEEYGDDAEVTIRGLDAGEFARVKDRAAAMQTQAGTPGGLPGSTDNVFAAMVLVDAPLLEKDRGEFAGENKWLDYKLECITRGVPPGFASWLTSRGNDLTTPDSGNSTPWHDR